MADDEPRVGLLGREAERAEQRAVLIGARAGVVGSCLSRGRRASARRGCSRTLANVADVATLAAEAHRALAPGGRWALAETVAGPGGDLFYPVPWADAPAKSHLLASDALRTVLERPGFAAEVWEVGPAAAAPAVAELAGEPQQPHAAVEIGLIMPNGDERMANLGRNIAEQRIAPVPAVLRRAA